MTRLKICGLRDARHAAVAAEAGADFLGFVFVEGVRRQLTPEQGAAVIREFFRVFHGGRSDGAPGAPHGGGPKLVGLFANQPVEFVNDVARACGLDLVQLCGDEGPEFWEGVEPAIIKQIKVRVDGSDAEKEAVVAATAARVDEVLAAGHTALLDADEPGHLGGTGTVFDWAVARAVAEDRAIVLAGGLTPTNVGQAIAKVGPWGVDVSSGVETGGVKDEGKIRAFADAVRAADTGSARL